MEAPRRKITAKVEPSSVHSPAPSRPISRAASPIVGQPLPPPDDSLSPSPSAAPRPKAKITSNAAGTLKTPKSSGSLAVGGRKTPVSSVVGRAARDRPASVVGAPTRSPFGQTNSPAVPPSRRAPSPQRGGPRLLSPEPPISRVSPGSRIGRPTKPPSPPLAKNATSQPASLRRALSPTVPAGRRNASPTRGPPLTLPRRTTSPTRSSIFGSQRSPTHRRVASASASSSVVSGGGDQPSTPQGDVAKTRLKLPSSLSSITLNTPSMFPSAPFSPSTPAYPTLAPPLPLSSMDSDRELHGGDSSPEPSDLSAPPSATLPELPSAQDPIRAVVSAPVTPMHAQPRVSQPQASAGFPRPRNSSVTIVGGADETPERPQVGGVVTGLNEGSPTAVVRVKAKVTHIIPPTNASVKPTAQARPQQLAAPPRQRSGSISASSSLSGVATSTLSRTSSVRVTSASTILSPPLRPVPALGLVAPGSRISIPPPMRSPSASTLSSSSSTSQASTSSRTNSSTQSTSVGRTPNDARSKTTSGPSKLGFASQLHPTDEDGVERDDSGIDMFEADDGEHELREEARSNRKIADLEISNKSLLAINATLEATKSRQAKEIRDLRRRLRESRLILPPPAFHALEQRDPLNAATSFEDDDDDEDSDDNDVTQLQADETFARVRNLLDQLMTSAKDALEAKPPVPDPETLGPVKKPIRVLNVHEAKQYVNEQTDESAESKATDSVAGDLAESSAAEDLAESSVAGDLAESIDEDSPSAALAKAEEQIAQSGLPTPKYQPASFGLGLFNRWSQR